MDTPLTHGPLPTFFIPHGGGPCFFMDWDPKDAWKTMETWLRDLAGTFAVRPKAILVISAHWEEDVFTVMSNPAPPLLYDYYGFPEHTYQIKYPAPGATELAKQVTSLLANAGIATRTDEKRGFDHGVFIPFKLIYPDADIPILQLSLKTGLEPAAHIAVGKALAPLREQGILIVGSGMSYHNLRGFGPVYGPVSDQFDTWLTHAACANSAEERNAQLTHWQQAPSARIAHPREEHLLPLMVAAGAAGDDKGERIYADRVLGLAISAYQFGESAGAETI